MAKSENIVLNTLLHTKQSVEAELIHLKSVGERLISEYNTCVFGIDKCVEDIKLIDNSIALLRGPVKSSKKEV